MPEVLHPTVSPGKLTPDQRDALQKMLASHTFATAPRLRGVLAYLVRSIEDGTVEQINEQVIGQDVFGKQAGYNASEDNIVRVTVRHLRSRLEEYYQSEGRLEAWVLTIPKGKYVPILVAARVTTTFAQEPLVNESVEATPEEAIDGSPLMASRPPARFSFASAMIWLPILLVAASLGYGLRYWLEPRTQVSGGVLGQFALPSEDVSVVVVDSNLEAYRQIFHRQVVLDDYIRRGYAHDQLDGNDIRLVDAQHFASGTNETNVSSTIFAAAVQRALENRRITIKHPHDASTRDFQNQKLVVLLGGPYINPWGQLFEKQMNFRLLPVPDAPASSQIHNQNPAHGELADYIPRINGNGNVNYVRIAILPNFNGSGHVITVGATSGESLEEAGAYLLSQESVRDLLKIFQARSVAALPPLEVLMEVGGLNAVPNSHRIVAYRAVSTN